MRRTPMVRGWVFAVASGPERRSEGSGRQSGRIDSPSAGGMRHWRQIVRGLSSTSPIC